METFAIAYVSVWFGVMLFVARMGMRQRRLQATIDDLQARMNAQTKPCESPAKAA